MAYDASGEVPVTFAKGVLDDVAEVTATVAGTIKPARTKPRR
jgi:hypothetical protein